MVRPYLVTGEAGAGKTRKLMEKAACIGGQVISSPLQTALAMAVMHGARRQLQGTLGRFCPQLPVTVSTIHSFALKIVNRWRRSLGLLAPVSICESSQQLSIAHGCTQATFDELMVLACNLLESTTVRDTLAGAHPLVIVDEFQDCLGNTLNFVHALSNSTRLLLAADHFQLLNSDEHGCPAAAWAEQLREKNEIDFEELVGCHRTNTSAILNAARALRANAKAVEPVVPVYYGHQPGQLAFRIFERFSGWSGTNSITTGSCALIVLSFDDPQLPKLLKSFYGQLEKRTPRRVNWHHTVSEEQAQGSLFAELGIDMTAPRGTDWTGGKPGPSGQALAISNDVMRYSRLRGLSTTPQDLVVQFAKLAVHNARAFSANSPQCQVLTVHGAKNREFDHVFVFWSYKSSGWSVEQQRRLLYNAVTRARCDCTVLVLGDSMRIHNDHVLSLLGTPKQAIDPSWKRKKRQKPKGVA